MLTSKDGADSTQARKLLDMWPQTVAAYAGDEYVVKIRDKEIRTRLVLGVAVRHQDPQGDRCRSSTTTAKCCAS